MQAQSKLCNLLFVRELNKRLQAEGAAVLVAACHPGNSMAWAQWPIEHSVPWQALHPTQNWPPVSNATLCIYENHSGTVCCMELRHPQQQHVNVLWKWQT